jgi:hypothetical protein
MSQSSALSGKQFPTSDVGEMQSGDWPGHKVSDTYALQSDYAGLKNDITTNGQQTPLRADMHISGSMKRSTLTNGHHRYYVARDTGKSHLNVGD